MLRTVIVRYHVYVYIFSKKHLIVACFGLKNEENKQKKFDQYFCGPQYFLFLNLAREQKNLATPGLEGCFQK